MQYKQGKGSNNDPLVFNFGLFYGLQHKKKGTIRNRPLQEIDNYVGYRYAFSNLQAHTLYSGIFAIGSSALFVRILAGASQKWNGT